MNKIIKLILLYVLSVISACSEKDNNVTPCDNCGSTNNTSSFVSASINGLPFYASSAESCQLLLNLIPGLRTMVLIAESNNHRIYLGTGDTNPDTELLDTVEYSLSGSTNVAIFDYSYVSSTDTISDCVNIEGTLKITFQDTVTRKISGTFEYVVLDDDHNNDTIKVTNGVFSKIKYDVIN